MDIPDGVVQSVFGHFLLRLYETLELGTFGRADFEELLAVEGVGDGDGLVVGEHLAVQDVGDGVGLGTA